MVGYLVLVPAGEQLQPALPVTVPEPAAAEEEAGPGVRLDLERRTAQVDGRPLDLTYLEFELLAHLTAHPHRVHTRDHLVSAVWGYGHVGDGRTVDVHVARLRRKLGPEHRESIVTIRRVGYKYVPYLGS
jgi:DNA-binding response OmpR family regulator